MVKMNVLVKLYMNRCKQENCNNLVFSKGLCKYHQLKKPIKQSREKTAQKKQIQYEKRDFYFQYHLERCVRSEESFRQINNPTKANICHILPKSLHPSLEDNIKNCIYLTFEEHERLDKLLFSLEFEKLEKEFKNSWQKICTIVEELLPLSKESSNLSRNFKKYLDGRNIKS